MADVHEMPAS